MKKKEVQFRSGGALSQVESVMLIEFGHITQHLVELECVLGSTNLLKNM